MGMSINMNYFRGVVLMLTMTALFSCDAPRLNPLDPENPNYNLSMVDGYIKTEAAPSVPLNNVKILWKNQNIFVYTDANGYFKLDGLPRNDGWLIIEKEKYSKDSLFLQLSSTKNFRAEKFLNAMPKLDNLLIYTSVENRYPDDQRYTLFIQAQISDAENDIDSVIVNSSALNFYKQLKYSAQTNSYELSYPYGGKTSSPSIDNAVGKNFEIIVRDRSKRSFNAGSSTILRIIKQEIYFESPANGSIVGPKPVFRWKRFLPGFNFKYLAQIYTDEIIPQLRWERNNISKDDIEIIPDLNLTNGDYFWVIWCIDEFQNRTRSKPATFVVR